MQRPFPDAIGRIIPFPLREFLEVELEDAFDLGDCPQVFLPSMARRDTLIDSIHPLNATDHRIEGLSRHRLTEVQPKMTAHRKLHTTTELR